MSIIDLVGTSFKELFNEEPLLVRSPGRVNLIGEHTDYNHGFVLPAAIDKAIYFAITPRADRRCRMYALDLKEEHEFRLSDLLRTTKGWPNYLMGVVDQLVKEGHEIGGFNCVFAGDIPIGAGLSSSAAIEAGLAYALNHLFDLGMEEIELVKLARRAENEFVGVQCGIMDQYINIFGEQDKVLRIDCRSLECEDYPFDYPVVLVLFDTGLSRSLASSEYNRRREECVEGVGIIKQWHPEVTHLRDVSAEMLAECRSNLSATIYRRCKYVVEENDRVLKACQALKQRDLQLFGRLMVQTHEGLSREYEVSCSELDYLVELVNDNPHVYGSRMMGAGFGGCTINLIEKDHVEPITKQVTEGYKNRFGLEPKTYVTCISAGTNIILVNESTPARIG
jgi:galactokinase